MRFFLGLLIFVLLSCNTTSDTEYSINGSGISNVSADDSVVYNAFNSKTSNIQVTANAVVSRILADDTIGSKHQKFIIRMPNSQTILVAHNIDLAPRVPNLQVNKSITVYGEYEWSDKGGTIHWTHIDPNKNHIDGWIKYLDNKYQ